MDAGPATAFEDAIEEQDEDLSQAYWARKEAADLVSAINAKQKAYFEALHRRGLLTMWQTQYAAYYGQDPSSAGTFETQQIGFDGEEGEQLIFRINEQRSYVRQQVTMATRDRPAFKCMALNSDYSSISQISASDTIISHFYKAQMGAEQEWLVVESDANFGSGYGWLRWDKDGGDEVDVPKQVTQPMALPDGSSIEVPQTVTEKKQSGAPVGTALYPWEVVQEPSSSQEHLWRMVRERCSKWELIAEYPEHAEKIAGIKALDDYAVEALFGFDTEVVTDDDVIVKHFYHARCNALPDGRYVGMVGDIILWDRSIPVPKGLPIKEMMTARFIGSCFGYADAWDLLAINQAIDQVNSDMITNFATFGRQVIVVDEGTDYDVDALANGQRVLTKLRDTDMPQAISFNAMPGVVFQALDYWHARMNSVSGQNAISRGDSSSEVKSGTHAALFHSIAIEFQHARQMALDSFREGMANLMLDLVRMNADAPFLIEVAGEDERPYLQEFTKQSIAGVRRVVVETANPMMRSVAGRLEIFNAISQLKTPEERSAAIQLITTGQSKGFTQKDTACEMRIKWENEQLAKGIPVPVLAGDNPFKHVRSHFADIESRTAQLNDNPEILQVQLAHIAEHIPNYLNLDPMLAAFLGIPPPPAKPDMIAPDALPVGKGGPANDNARGGPPAANDNAKPPEAMKAPAAQQDPAAGVALPSPAKPPAQAQVQPGTP